MGKEVRFLLEYLSKSDKVTLFKISQDLGFDINKVQKIIRSLRSQKLVNATEGWSNEGRTTYTNIEITSKGVKSMQKKQSKRKKTIAINVKENHGNISVGNWNKQKVVTSSTESLISKVFWWAMGIFAALIVSGLAYYFHWN